jgi:hypothetical protein
MMQHSEHAESRKCGDHGWDGGKLDKYRNMHKRLTVR